MGGIVITNIPNFFFLNKRLKLLLANLKCDPLNSLSYYF